jgi:transcription antitermination factor NusG
VELLAESCTEESQEFVMPILAAEPHLFPADLLESPPAHDQFFSQEKPGSENPGWWVFYTRPRQEKSLARDLLQREIAFYLPLVPRRLLIRGRPVYSHVPLFNGYVFVYGSREDRLRTLMTNRAAQVFAVDDGQRLRLDLQNIKMLIDSGAALTIESRLEANQPVRVRAGALMGMEGIVVRRKNQTRLVVWVKMLQQGVSLEIEDYLLEPIG